MDIEDRLKILEKRIDPKEKWRYFICVTGIGTGPSTLLISEESGTKKFDNKSDFVKWANNDGMEKQEIERLCCRLYWD